MLPISINLPDHFLDEEERCGYVVTKEMKKVWAIMLDLLSEFDRVCSKYGLRYQASWGTLLGAVRHKGFIPWDDDLDVQMFRDDYDQLCEIGPKEFKHPYFFQSKRTDPLTGFFCCKLRNSETTAIAPWEKHSVMKYNKGIFMDIFPVDIVPDDEDSRNSFIKRIEDKRISVLNTGRKMGIYSETTSIVRQMLKRFLHIILTPYRNNHIDEFINEYDELEQLCSSLKGTNSSMVSMPMFMNSHSKMFYYNDYKESTLMDFEFLKIPVAQKYDHALRQLYGDYNQLIVTHSHTALFDPEKSYLNYSI